MRYVGNELELFADALNWKTYIGRQLRCYVYGDVLEVGAGLGGSTQYLCHEHVRTWTCIEPDESLAAKLRARNWTLHGGIEPEVREGTVADLEHGRRFDCIVYIDVLEHIEDDRNELAVAARHLKDGGRLVVLAPAHEKLFSEFDRALGHYRRYSRSSLYPISPEGLLLEDSFYLDALGLLLSLGNKWVLHRSIPSRGQIQTWDRVVVPLSRIVDGLLGRNLGKSVVAVWRKPTL